MTPQRAYRNILLRMNAKIQALKEAYWNLQKEDVDLEELRAKLNDPSTSEYDKRRYEIEIARKLDSRGYLSKLVKDAVIEVQTLYQYFRALPKYTREEFEAAEREYFTAKLTQQATGVVGALESLKAMGLKLGPGGNPVPTGERLLAERLQEAIASGKTLDGQPLPPAPDAEDVIQIIQAITRECPELPRGELPEEPPEDQ